MRRGPGRAPPRTAPACLRPQALRVVAPGEAGVRARVERSIYRGGHFRLEAHVEAKPDILLHLSASDPCAFAPGQTVSIAVDDGWILPEAGT